mmetsp:Transcript_75281/g.207711  ORF Transcript_75281/g.207711 Transcript_75281/m.207711 type:complete len:230 (+) Transcript_75281:2229-2918(+)
MTSSHRRMPTSTPTETAPSRCRSTWRGSIRTTAVCNSTSTTPTTTAPSTARSLARSHRSWACRSRAARLTRSSTGSTSTAAAPSTFSSSTAGGCASRRTPRRPFCRWPEMATGRRPSSWRSTTWRSGACCRSCVARWRASQTPSRRARCRRVPSCSRCSAGWSVTSMTCPQRSTRPRRALAPLNGAAAVRARLVKRMAQHQPQACMHPCSVIRMRCSRCAPARSCGCSR